MNSPSAEPGYGQHAGSLTANALRLRTAYELVESAVVWIVHVQHPGATMSESVLDSLKAVDFSVLTYVVRQDQVSPDFNILDWDVRHLSNKGIRSPDGLFLFHGTGQDEHGKREWSVVLKRLENEDSRQVPINNFWHWKREPLFIESDLYANLPGPVRTPKFYRIEEDADSVHIWMEFIQDDSPPHWTEAEFVFTAYEFGRFNAATLRDLPVHSYPWQTKTLARDWAEPFPPHDAWESPFVTEAFSHDLRERILKLWDDRNDFYAWLESGELVFSHFDCHRRNLAIQRGRDGMRQVVAMDWALCGQGPVGGDPAMLIGMSANLNELDLTELSSIGDRVFENYLVGLRDGGWQGSRDAVRLSFVAWMAMFAGLTAPKLTEIWTSEVMRDLFTQQFGIQPKEFASRLAVVAGYALDLADEARRLAGRLPG